MTYVYMLLSLISICLSLSIYIYIYTHTYLCTYTCALHTPSESARRKGDAPGALAAHEGSRRQSAALARRWRTSAGAP